MSKEESSNLKIISSIIVILLVVAGYLVLKDKTPRDSSLDSLDNSEMVVVENTPMVEGRVLVPQGFPEDIPVEVESIFESATTRYPKQSAKQLSLSYKTSSTMVEKYTEYKNHLTNAGFTVREDSNHSSIRAIFGSRPDANLAVAISSFEGMTIVQLSYLVKSL